MDRPLAPQRERGLDVGLRLMRPPAVDRTEVLKGTLHVAHGNRPPEVLDFVAGRAQGDQPNKSLNARLAVVVPDFVGLDGVLLADTAANLALVACLFVAGFAKAVPLARLEARAQVVAP